MSRIGPNGNSSRSVRVIIAPLRPKQIDAQRGFGINKLQDGLTEWVEWVYVPKQEVYPQRCGNVIERWRDEVDVVQRACGSGEATTQNC
jgi:hypothetical protein